MIRTIPNLKEELAEQIASQRARGPFFLEVDGCSIPLEFHASVGSKTLIVYFHGSVNRETRKIPVFSSALPDLWMAHQLCVSDPSILAKAGFSLSWYAGHAEFVSQNILRELFANIIEVLKVDRVIFFGASGGGFAALFYSFYFKDSVSVVTMPQTDMFRYNPVHLKSYISSCWPDLKDMKFLSDFVCTDVCKLYSRPTSNTVVYLQSAGDHYHLKNHMIPFLAAISKNKQSRIVVDCGFWGKLGHSGSVPSDAYLPWLKAVVAAGSTEPDDLLMARHALVTSTEARPVKSKATATEILYPAYLRMADLLRDLQLKS